MRYVAQRILHAALLLLAISFFSFALLQLAPGDFFDSMRLNPQISRHTLTGIRSEYDLNQPLPIRYAHWLASHLHVQMGIGFDGASDRHGDTGNELQFDQSPNGGLMTGVLA